PKIPRSAAESDALRKKLADRPLYLKTFVSRDGRAAAIDAFFEEMDDDEFARRGIDQRIEAIVEASRGPEEIHYTGLPHIKVYTANALWSDLKEFVPVTLAIIVVVLLLCFRSIRGVTLPALTVLVSLTWTLGIMVLAGSGLTLGTTSLPPLVLVIGTAYSLHVLAEYYELAQPHRSMPEVVLETLRRVGPPALIAALTTVVGFASIVVNPIPSIRAMGVYSSIGIALAFVLSVVLVPACLALMPPPRGRRPAARPPPRGNLARLAVTVLAMLPMPWIRVDSNFQSFFRADDPIRRATDAVNAHLAGSAAFYVAIDGHEKNVLKKWDTLRRIKDLQTFIDSFPGVQKTVSLVDLLEQFDRGNQQVAPGELVVGPSGELVEAEAPAVKTTFWENPAQLAAVLGLISSSPKTFASVVTEDFPGTSIPAGASLTRSSDISQMVAKIREYAEGRFPPELDIRPTGTLILLTKTTGNIIAGQIESLALTAGIIFVIMAAMFL